METPGWGGTFKEDDGNGVRWGLSRGAGGCSPWPCAEATWGRWHAGGCTGSRPGDGQKVDTRRVSVSPAPVPAGDRVSAFP